MKYTWLVEKYLEGELHGEELREFELSILRNPDVAKEVEEIKKLHAFSREQIRKKSVDYLLEDKERVSQILEEDIISDLQDLKIIKLNPDETGFQNFKKKVESASLNYRIHENNKNKIILNKNLFWGAAAVITLLLAIGITGIVGMNSTKDTKVLYSQFYEPYHYTGNIRAIEDQSQEVYDLARDAYIHANYGLALEYFNQVSAGSSYYTMTFLFKGICFMETDQIDKAIQAFNQLSGNRTLNPYGVWYRGLCYLKLNDPDKARIEFKKIVKSKEYKMDEAKKILKSL